MRSRTLIVLLVLLSGLWGRQLRKLGADSGCQLTDPGSPVSWECTDFLLLRADLPGAGLHCLRPQESPAELLRRLGLEDCRLLSGEGRLLREEPEGAEGSEGSKEGCQLRPESLPVPSMLALGLPIDINHSSVEDLDAVPGIGPTTARRIVAHREGAGPFEAVDDLVQVKGVGPVMLRSMRPYVEVWP